MLLSVLLVAALMLAIGLLWYFLALPHNNEITEKKLAYVSFELDQDRVPFPIGSTLTVFGVTLTVVEEGAGVNQVNASKDYNEQWRNFFAALLAAEIAPNVLFISRYSVSYSFYMTVRELQPMNVPPNPQGLFDNAIIIHEIGTKDAV